MKTRIIQTKFWHDTYIQKLKPLNKLVFLFLISNDQVEKTGAYEISIDDISYFSGVDQKTVINSIQKFQDDKKIFYIDGFIVLVNHLKYQDYSKGSGIQKQSYQKEYDALPDKVKELFKHKDDLDSFQLVDNQLPTGYQLDINNKEEIINNKIEIIKEKKENNFLTKQIEKQVTDLHEVVQYYNDTFGKSISSTKGFESNFAYWNRIHDVEKIKNAIAVAVYDKFWRDKMTLQILFRRKNPKGEDVDYIEDLCNRTQQMGNIAII